MKISKKLLLFLPLLSLPSISLVGNANSLNKDIDTSSHITKVSNDDLADDASTFLDGVNIKGTIYYVINDNKLVITSSVNFEGKNLSFKANKIGKDSSYPLTQINESAFLNNNNIFGSLSLPNSLTTIEENAFAGCINLNGALNIPSSLLTIGNKAFIKTSFSSINVDSNNSNYQLSSSFKSDKNEQNYVLVQSSTPTVTTLDTIVDGLAIGDLYINKNIANVSGSDKLENCYNLKSVNFDTTSTIGVTITSMPSFYNDRAFHSINIPKSISTIRDKSFQFTQIDSISIDKNNLYYQFASNLPGTCYVVIDQRTNNGNFIFGDNTIAIAGLAFGEIMLPETITQIADNAFAYCYNIRTVTLFNCPYLKTIGSKAFYMCYHLNDYIYLDSLSFGSRLEEIKDQAFYGCPFIKIVYLPSSLKRIGDQAFMTNIDANGNYIYWNTINVQFEWTENYIKKFIDNNEEYKIGKNVYPVMEQVIDKLTYDTIYDNLQIYVNKQLRHYYLENKEIFGLTHIDFNHDDYESYLADKNIHSGNIPNSNSTFINSLALGFSLGIGIPVIIGTTIGIYFYNQKKKRSIK